MGAVGPARHRRALASPSSFKKKPPPASCNSVGGVLGQVVGDDGTLYEQQLGRAGRGGISSRQLRARKDDYGKRLGGKGVIGCGVLLARRLSVDEAATAWEPSEWPARAYFPGSTRPFSQPAPPRRHHWPPTRPGPRHRRCRRARSPIGLGCFELDDVAAEGVDLIGVLIREQRRHDDKSGPHPGPEGGRRWRAACRSRGRRRRPGTARPRSPAGHRWSAWSSNRRWTGTRSG